MSAVGVTVVGGGLVGALSACLLGNRGFNVNLYEQRSDIRKSEHVTGRSINLALSVRGRSALRAIGVDEEIISKHAIPMYGRLIHDLEGKKRPIPYGKKNQCIYSVGRRHLNEVLLNVAETHPNVEIHFDHKLVSLDLHEGTMVFKVRNGSAVKASSEWIVGCDGAYSAVRKQMLKEPLFNYSQEYIPHGYLELTIPPTEEGDFAMEVNYLHIWPRKTFMLIALPNQDRTYTVTLFMPFQRFQELADPGQLVSFFNNSFPDALQLIGENRLIEDFFRSKPSPLVSVKCSPYNVGKAVLMGDAAHAMVPFYGQGMNCGFEDCLIFDELLEQREDFGKAIADFSEIRQPDAVAICDLAMYNYIEMRDLVTSEVFLFRKRLDTCLNRLFPNWWVPLYSTVSFSRMRYTQCIRNREWQNTLISGFALICIALIVISVIALYTYCLN